MGDELVKGRGEGRGGASASASASASSLVWFGLVRFASAAVHAPAPALTG